MNALYSATAATGSPQHTTVRPTRYFAVTYFDGDAALGCGRQSVFRSKRLNRAKRIARSNMPPDADRMELVEINAGDFQARREAHRCHSDQ
ncbi:hypothetical protein [Sinorhizobium fredii]|uniref:hypothetical protein n=1 Tax=Rhizobium fredii TaxID=380 RepID=UPI0012FD926D|nr:hypothetical protein [Sinorhizobium fredii]